MSDTHNIPAISQFINESQTALFGDDSTIKEIMSRGAYEQIGTLTTITDNHLKEMAENNKEVNRATNIFGRSQSRYMNYLFTVSALFPHRNAQQLLAEMESRRSALSENIYKQKAQIVEGKEKEDKLKKMVDEYEKLTTFLSTLPEEAYTEVIGEFTSKEKKRNINYKKRQEELYYAIPKLQVEIDKLHSQLADSRVYIEGALRTILQHQRAYNSIIEENGMQNWTEVDYENAEPAYHVATAFAQAMEDVYSRGGVIDKGDLIYMRQIGIHPAIATMELRKHMQYIDSLIAEDARVGKKDPHTKEMIAFLMEMGEKYGPAHKTMLEVKGLSSYQDDDVMVK
jgi:hypothetical protein